MRVNDNLGGTWDISDKGALNLRGALKFKGGLNTPMMSCTHMLTYNSFPPVKGILYASTFCFNFLSMKKLSFVRLGN